MVPVTYGDTRIFYTKLNYRNKKTGSKYIYLPKLVDMYLKLDVEDEIGIMIWKTGRKLPKDNCRYEESLKKALKREIEGGKNDKVSIKVDKGFLD